MRTKFQQIEYIVNNRVKKIFDKDNARTLTERQEFFDYEDESVKDGEEDDMSKQILKFQNNQLIDLKKHLERYFNTLPLFGFNSGRYNLNLINFGLIPYLICDKEIEPKVIKKANDFISFRFGDVQLLELMRFLKGATTLDLFLKGYKSSETNEWFDSTDCTELPSHETFFSKLRIPNPLENDFNDYENLINGGLDQ